MFIEISAGIKPGSTLGHLFVSTTAIDWLYSLDSEMTYYVSSGC